jgi:hypothetical protein
MSLDWKGIYQNMFGTPTATPPGASVGKVVVYYRDKKGRRHVLHPSTILREAKRLPRGYHMVIFWAGPDEVAFGSPLSPGWRPLGPYILDIPWNLSKYGAENAYDAVVEEFVGQRSRTINPRIQYVKED